MIPQSLDERTADTVDLLKASEAKVAASINCCLPGIVQNYDADTQTATVQAAVRKRIRTPKGVVNVELPLMTDVPVLMLGDGTHYMTFPISKGDECLILFADNCIDAWYQSGGVQNQPVARLHDLSDGFAIVGFRSAGKAIESPNTSIPQITNLIINDVNMSEWMQSVNNAITSQTVNVTGSTPSITAESNKRYICGEVSTISFTPSSTGVCDVVFISGSTAAVLDVPEGVLWPSWFDPDNLETNTKYELNVSDGVNGLVATWDMS